MLISTGDHGDLVHFVIQRHHKLEVELYTDNTRLRYVLGANVLRRSLRRIQRSFSRSHVQSESNVVADKGIYY